MAPMRPSRSCRFSLLGMFLATLLLLLELSPSARATGLFKVRHKFMGRRSAITDLLAHDSRRHSRMLAVADLPLGGIGLPTDTGLYYAEIGLGTPPKKFFVQVDTGSDVFWVNCASCKDCPEKSNLGLDLTLYNPNTSVSRSFVSCEDNFCVSRYGNIPGCVKDYPCRYKVTYGDGSSTAGFFVTDSLQFPQVSNDHQTTLVDANVSFGCGSQQSGDLGTSQSLDGLLGFAQSNSSVISQLAAAGKVNKIFAHCLDTVQGGGIFVIGHVVQPKVKTTPLVPDQLLYKVNLKAIEVGGAILPLPSILFDTGDGKGAIIDSGTTLSFVPEIVYKSLMRAIFSKHRDMTFYNNQGFLCFQYPGSVDNDFPEVVFHFENSLLLNVYPHDYLFQSGNVYCVGWQSGGTMSKDGKNTFLLGDLVLSNKLVVYDLENQVIGWTNYNSFLGKELVQEMCAPREKLKITQVMIWNISLNKIASLVHCQFMNFNGHGLFVYPEGSSSIKVQDGKSGAIYTVDAHNLSPSGGPQLQNSIALPLFLLAFVYTLIY